jgi:hypothetical protein
MDIKQTEIISVEERVRRAIEKMEVEDCARDRSERMLSLVIVGGFTAACFALLVYLLVR